MAKRLVEQTFWDDPIIGDLDGHAKYLFLYLISSPRGNSSGLFDITSRVIQFHTGMTSEKIDKAMNALEDSGRIVRSGDWVWVVNQFKHDCNKNNIRVRLQMLYLLEKISDEKLVSLVADKYEVQLSLTHGSLEVLLRLSGDSLKIKNRYKSCVENLKTRLNGGSVEPQQRCQDQEQDHDNDHDKEQNPSTDYPIPFTKSWGKWLEKGLWAAGDLIKAKAIAYQTYLKFEKEYPSEIDNLPYMIKLYAESNGRNRESYKDFLEQGIWKRFRISA